ncbi:MAG: hypothetical protein J5725_04110 [Bacteroidales bacterium]|nr:hypothetical protein [Bacteroidales bacterium]
MADVRRTTLPDKMDEWIPFMRNLNCDIITIDEEGEYPYICIGDVYKIRFNEAQYDDRKMIVIYQNDDHYEHPMGITPMTVTISYTSDFVWLTIYDPANKWYSMRTCCIYYEVLGGRHLYGYFYKTESPPNISFNALGTIRDKLTGYQYTHKAVLNYDSPPNSISLCSQILLRNNIKVITDINLLSCTTVEVGQVITIDEHQYYSIGTHTLVPMWNEPTPEPTETTNETS